MTYTVLRTPHADRQVAGLRGRRADAFRRFETALAREGCAALGYRLTGPAPLRDLCVKHLYGNDRAVVAFEDDQAWVLVVGPHDEEDAARDVYRGVYEIFGVEPPDEPRTKPPFCDEAGEAPCTDPPDVASLVERAARTLRSRR